jgi:Flp pilus assembly pilin Flp
MTIDLRLRLQAKQGKEVAQMQWVQVRNWLRREEGQDLSEYALLLFLIVIAAVGAVTLLGGTVSNVLDQVSAALGAAIGP